MTIIAIQGPHNSGKTTSLNILRDLMLNNGFTAVPNVFVNHSGRAIPPDFRDLLEKNSKSVGITTPGDTLGYLTRGIDALIPYQPDIIVCACLTYGATVNYLNTNFGNSVIYISKRRDPAMNNQQENQADAHDILNRIHTI